MVPPAVRGDGRNMWRPYGVGGGGTGTGCCSLYGGRPGPPGNEGLLLPGIHAEVAVGEGEVHADAAGVVGGMERNA